MISCSNRFKELMRAPVKTIQMCVTTNEPTPQTFASSDVLMSVDIEADGFFFGAVTESLTMKLIGTDYNLVGHDVKPTLQVLSDAENEIYEELSYNSFRVYEQTVDLEKGITTVKGYDAIGIAAKLEYAEGAIIWPCTVANLASQVAANIGIALLTDMSTLPNSTYIISEDLYANISGANYRNILTEIAGATASVCRVSDDKLVFEPALANVVDDLTYDNLLKVKFEPRYGVINSVVLSRMPQEDNIAVRDETSITLNGLTELKLANNEILDDEREILAQPILNAVDGFFFDPCEATTEGHGWYECGDRVQISNDQANYETIITHTKLTFAGGIKETIKGVAPDATKTNYALAGGISKTIYNTEIKVDKQGQRIESIVEEQSMLENTVNNNYTSITQNISNVVTSVQNSGGNNLIKNSAMYSLDDEKNPLNWTLSGAGSISIVPSAEAAINGSLSRQNISLKNMIATQVIEVKADTSETTEKTYYSFSCKIKKTAAGECWVRISDGTEGGTREIVLENGDESFYKDFSIEKILPNSSNLTISVYGSSDSEFSITDMMLAVGDYRSQWTQANGEFANTQVTIDSNGVTIRSSNLSGTYSKQTPQELSTYSNNKLVATVNESGISAPKIDATKAISMPPIKIVPRSDGWAFVKA